MDQVTTLHRIALLQNVLGLLIPRIAPTAAVIPRRKSVARALWSCSHVTTELRNQLPPRCSRYGSDAAARSDHIDPGQREAGGEEGRRSGTEGSSWRAGR